MEGSGGAGVAFRDRPALPPGPVGKFMLTQMAAVAELEASLISQRTRAALAQAKARGTRLGNPRLRAGTPELAADVMPYIDQARAAGATTLRRLAGALNARGARTPRNGLWHPASVRRVLGYAGD